jgi:proteasome activator subunit 4
MFIVAAVQHIKLGDLSLHQSGLSLSSDAPAEDMMNMDTPEALPEGNENAMVLSKAEERALVRDSTAAFADWVTMLFRRVFALYENLPEEGGRRNTTGGKQEESVLKAIKSTLDVVCLHLSDQMFDLVLKVVFEYATNNAKANAVRAFGQLVACLARVHPTKTIDKFLPYCVSQINDELRHGASNVRATSTNVAMPSDTTLHWSMLSSSTPTAVTDFVP